jgi:hypothetical protein
MANKITQTGSPKDFVDHSYFYKPYMIPADDLVARRHETHRTFSLGYINTYTDHK